MKTLTALLLFLCLVSCTKNAHLELERAEKLMSSAHDSSLVILENLKADYEDMSDPDKALFGMLYIQARDKNSEKIECDDQLEFAINYYTQTNQKIRLANCLLYKSRVFASKREYEATSTNLLNALKLAENGKDVSLLGRIYFDLGRISGFQDHIEDALNYYRKSIYYFDQTGETRNSARLYTLIGDIHEYYERLDSAIYYNRMAQAITVDSIGMGDIFNNFGHVYYNMEQYDSAVFYLKKSLDYPFYDTNMSMRLYHLARTYYMMDHIDSAEYFMHKAMDEDMDIYFKEEIYRLGIGIAVEKGESALIPIYMKELSQIQDSIAMLNKQTDIKTIERLQILSSYSQIVRNQRRILLATAIVVFLIGSAISYLLYTRFKLKKKTADKYKERLEEKYEELEEKNELLDETNELLEKKQEQIQKTVEIQILEVNRELEKVSEKYAEKRKKSNLLQREALKKDVYREVLNFDNEHVFIGKMNKTLNHIPEKLKCDFPEMNYKEIAWCCLFLLKIPTTDIALILEYTQSSLYKFKQRLGNKLGYTSMKDFEQMLYDKLNN